MRFTWLFLIWKRLSIVSQPEEFVEWVRILYAYPRSQIQALAGTSAEFPVAVGVHQGSALSFLLFIFVMDAVTRDLQDPSRYLEASVRGRPHDCVLRQV
ncbi:hypothetical protein Y032_0127g1392 [Ancylostoma ceylanicum]|uniref:Reverse transcriptase domain-containing protein n=1 Tax=Ancylostoma ceylanicum TaxID=53326 RepID=A0A016T840_9BILA|nr:hypothetical protein Y032_0127g1392 [Ancylostoma ceylanicum]